MHAKSCNEKRETINPCRKQNSFASLTLRAAVCSICVMDKKTSRDRARPPRAIPKRHGGYDPRVVQRVAVIGSIAVVCLGLVVLVAAIVISERTEPSVSAKTLEHQSPFDGKRAYEDLRKVLAFGPRPAGSDSLAKLRVFIKDELSKAGLRVWEQAFEASTPMGKRSMVNIVGAVEGTSDDIIIVGNHYDTKYFPDIAFVGANDGGSTTAWMLEMARVIGAKRTGRTLWLCFFDGEEAFGEWSKTNSLYGSRAFVDYLRGRGELSKVNAMVNMDMIGDCDLDIRQDRDAPEWLTQTIWDTARRVGHERAFLAFGHPIDDDHIPFRRAGVPAIEIIDFNYGATAQEHAKTWHTARDTIDRVCADSLQATGDVIYHALPEIDGFLDM